MIFCNHFLLDGNELKFEKKNWFVLGYCIVPTKFQILIFYQSFGKSNECSESYMKKLSNWDSTIVEMVMQENLKPKTYLPKQTNNLPMFGDVSCESVLRKRKGIMVRIENKSKTKIFTCRKSYHVRATDNSNYQGQN